MYFAEPKIIEELEETGRGISGHHQEIQIPGRKIGVYPISETAGWTWGSLMKWKK